MKPTRTSLAPTIQQSERLNKAVKELFKPIENKLRLTTIYLSERLRTTTKTERLLFACCAYYVGAVLMFKIMGI